MGRGALIRRLDRSLAASYEVQNSRLEVREGQFAVGSPCPGVRQEQAAAFLGLMRTDINKRPLAGSPMWLGDGASTDGSPISQ